MCLKLKTDFISENEKRRDLEKDEGADEGVERAQSHIEAFKVGLIRHVTSLCGWIYQGQMEGFEVSLH